MYDINYFITILVIADPNGKQPVSMIVLMNYDILFIRHSKFCRINYTTLPFLRKMETDSVSFFFNVSVFISKLTQLQYKHKSLKYTLSKYTVSTPPQKK